jgi:LysR family nitrogen assimilation transcriptional regulator
MDLRQLRIFLDVAEAGSFSKAAAILGIAQPALSRQIRGLESELNQTLLIRNGRGVRLSEAGLCLVGHATRIFREVDDATRALDDLRGAAVGAISLGMPATLAKILIVPIVAEFRRQFPRATIRVIEGLSTYLKEFLTAGRIDAALLYDMSPCAAYDVNPVLNEQLFLISSKPDVAGLKNITPDLLARFPLILPTRPNAIRVLVERHLSAGGKTPNVVLEADAIVSALELVAAGHGHTILSKNALTAWQPTTRNLVATPLRPALRTELSLVVSTRGALTPLQTAALSVIPQVAQRLLV